MKPVLADILDEVFLERDAWTAVESFSAWHQDVHVHAAHYEGLVPLSSPALGERYAFEVDLDRCSGCKACVTACHSLNGLDEGESWRQVGLLREPGPGSQTTVTSSCHHCEDPACSNGCPTLAYEKMDDGIVKHLDDQCMGCRYCEWTCPYGAPRWNAERGIVRKCDLCHSRLRVGEAPACVQACPNGAIAVRLVQKDGGEREGTMDLPGVVDPAFTRPSTRYLSREPFSRDLRPAHEDSPRPEEPHTPLAFLLVATQWAAGVALLLALRALGGVFSPPPPAIAAACLLVGGLGIGTLHLGRPDRAWRAFLGWRRSWFSREVLVFGAAAPVFLLWALRSMFPRTVPEMTETVLSVSSAIVGGAGVFCSVRIYLATPRPFWNRPATSWRFLLTVLGGGAVLAGAFGGPWIRAFGILSVASGIAKAWLVRRDVRSRRSGHPLAGTALLLRGPLHGQFLAQSILFALAVVSALVGTWMTAPLWFALAAVLRFSSDLVERTLFFRAALPARMPGGPLA